MTEEAANRPGIGILELVNAALRHWKLLVAMPFAAALAGVAIALLLPEWYAATTAFVPESKANALPSSLASLAGQFGVSLGERGSQSPQFYADVVQGREVLEEVLSARFPVRHDSGQADSVALIDYLEVEATTPRSRIEKGVKALHKALQVTVDPRTGIVRVRVELRDPLVAAAVANRLIEGINTFNQQTRRTQGRARRVFVEQRIAEAQRDLQDAEDALQSWGMRNRQYQGYPELEVQHQRLERRVQLRLDVYQSLYREYESARIEEVNDTPVITVVEHAIPPTRRSRPARAVLVLLFIVLGTALAALLALAAEYVGRLGVVDAAGMQEFRRLTGSLRGAARRAGGVPPA